MVKIGADVIRDKYTGRVAEVYDGRAGSPKWAAETAGMARFLDRIGPGASVLDIPVGTGRFLVDYRDRGMPAIGMDVSQDMMAQARIKVPDADLRYGDILAIDMPDASVDAAIAIRIMSWLHIAEMRQALLELARVSRQWIITGGGRSSERRTIARDVAGFELVDEAIIDRDQCGDYTLVLLRRCSASN